MPHSELAHHEELYAGFAQQHFAKPAVRAFREDLVRTILRRTGAHSQSRILSIGCGIGDTELLLAPHVREIHGIDLSPTGISSAQETAGRFGIRNAAFSVSSWANAAVADRYDVVMAIFFLHHLTESERGDFPIRMRTLLRPSGCFYALDPSRYRLAGLVGSLVVPHLMRRYHTDGERPLNPWAVTRHFRNSGFAVEMGWYDFGSTAMAGLLPSWRMGYRASRVVDNLLTRIPIFNMMSGSFDITARA